MVIEEVKSNTDRLEEFNKKITGFQLIVEKLKDFRMQDVTEEIQFAKDALTNEVKECMTYINQIQYEVQSVKSNLLEQRKEDVKEIEMVKDAIAEFVEARLQVGRDEINQVAQMVVILTENCLIE